MVPRSLSGVIMARLDPVRHVRSIVASVAVLTYVPEARQVTESARPQLAELRVRETFVALCRNERREIDSLRPQTG